MKARQVKKIEGKTVCDRCQQTASVMHECVFTFRESYAYWKALWQKQTGLRFTNKRKGRLAANEGQIDLKANSAVEFWMDLCPICFSRCSQAPGDGWPMEFYHCVLGAPTIPSTHEVRVKSAEVFVRKKTDPMASGEMRRSLLGEER